MAFVQHIAFTNSVRFAEDVYYFDYGGVQFKLVQNDPSKHSDVLLTVVPNDDMAAEDRAFAAAGEFVSALAWYIGLPMAVEPGGGMSMPDVTLQSARCACFGPPQFFPMGNVRGHSISRIAAIETGEQRRALALYREARSANKAILSFLLYWQVMDIPPQGQAQLKARHWVDAEEKAGRIHARDDQRRVLDLYLKGRSLGLYFEDDCRHAIAHLQRYPGKRTLVFDDHQDLRRIQVSADIARDLADRYIRTDLGLSKGMTLLRKGEDGFPVYITDGSKPAGYIPAYP